jgi:hypothetical protein
MKTLILTAALLLSGCTTVVPVTQRWPEAPGLQSMQKCPELKKLEANPQLSDVARTITLNYTEYYSCVVKLEAWQEWYAKQELIHKGLK